MEYLLFLPFIMTNISLFWLFSYTENNMDITDIFFKEE